MAHRWKVPKPLPRKPLCVILPKKGRAVYKYFLEHRYAELFLDGEVLFRSLAYFRDIEDAVRGDEYEGTSKFLPEGGLHIHNQTQNTKFTLPSTVAFEAVIRAYEIFVFCTSHRLSGDVARDFQAVTCVEIGDIKEFCRRVRSELPPGATFRVRPVEYYSEAQNCNPRWALADEIAISKLDRWSSQEEYRFLFSVTDALGFERAELRLVSRDRRPVSKPDEHIKCPLSIGSLRDICVVHECATLS